LDAKAAGFDVVVLEDASAAVNVAPGDEQRALDELRAANVAVANSSDVTGSAAAAVRR